MFEVRKGGQEAENKLPETLTTNWFKSQESSQLESKSRLGLRKRQFIQV